MSNQPFGPHPSSPSKKLPIEGDSADVPSFGCVVYVSHQEGVVRARVANLAGIEASGADQRAVLGQIVATFKAAVSSALAEGSTPDWIDPPAAKRDGERKLFLPVHL